VSWWSKESSSDSHSLQVSADSLLDVFSQKLRVCVPRLITNSVMQVTLFYILFNYLISKFNSLLKPKIKFLVQKANRLSVPEIGCFCILHNVKWKYCTKFRDV